MENYLLFFILVIAAFLLFKRSRTSVKKQTAIIIFGMFGPRISFTSTFHMPILEKYRIIDLGVRGLEVRCGNQDNIRCKDYIKIKIVCCLFYQFRKDPTLIMKFLNKNDEYSPIESNSIYEPAFKDILKQVVADFDFLEIYAERELFRDKILESAITRFPEIQICDVAIDFVEQIPLSELNPDDEHDRKAIKRIETLLAEQNALKQNNNVET